MVRVAAREIEDLDEGEANGEGGGKEDREGIRRK